MYVCIYKGIHYLKHIYKGEAATTPRQSQPGSDPKLPSAPAQLLGNGNTLRVQATKVHIRICMYIHTRESICIFCLRNPTYGLGCVLQIWVLGPLGR